MEGKEPWPHVDACRERQVKNQLSSAPRSVARTPVEGALRPGRVAEALQSAWFPAAPAEHAAAARCPTRSSFSSGV